MPGNVTVVVITRNRRDSTLHIVSRLSALPEQPPIVVVDNDSTDGTPAAVRAEFPAVTVVAAGGNLGAAGRNVGVLHARTSYVAFADDDSWWAPGSLRIAEKTFDEHPRLALLAARVLVGPEDRDDPVNEALASGVIGQQPDLPGPSVLGFVACGAVVRRNALLQVGGFHAAYRVGGEERLVAVDLARAGWGLAYVDAVVAHHHPQPRHRRPRRQRRTARNDVWTAWLRRPLRVALHRTVEAGPLAALDAARGAPWLLRERVVVPPRLEQLIRQVEAG